MKKTLLKSENVLYKKEVLEYTKCSNENYVKKKLKLYIVKNN